jgi:hypothetical protein
MIVTNAPPMLQTSTPLAKVVKTPDGPALQVEGHSTPLGAPKRPMSVDPGLQWGSGHAIVPRRRPGDKSYRIGGTVDLTHKGATFGTCDLEALITGWLTDDSKWPDHKLVNEVRSKREAIDSEAGQYGVAFLADSIKICDLTTGKYVQTLAQPLGLRPLKSPPPIAQVMGSDSGPKLVIRGQDFDLSDQTKRSDNAIHLRLGDGYELVSSPRTRGMTVSSVELRLSGQTIGQCDLEAAMTKQLGNDRWWGGHALANEMKYVRYRYDYETCFLSACARRGNSSIAVLGFRPQGSLSGRPGANLALVRINLRPFGFTFLRQIRYSSLGDPFFPEAYGFPDPILFEYDSKDFLLDGDTVHEVYPNGSESSALARVPTGKVSGVAANRWVLVWSLQEPAKTSYSPSNGSDRVLMAFDLATLKIRTLDRRPDSFPGLSIQTGGLSNMSPYAIVDEQTEVDRADGMGKVMHKLVVNASSGTWTRLPDGGTLRPVQRYGWTWEQDSILVYDLDTGRLVQTIANPLVNVSR